MTTAIFALLAVWCGSLAMILAVMVLAALRGLLGLHTDWLMMDLPPDVDTDRGL